MVASDIDYISIHNHFVILLVYDEIAVKATLQKLQRCNGIVKVLNIDKYRIKPTILIELWFASRYSNHYVMATLDLVLEIYY